MFISEMRRMSWGSWWLLDGDDRMLLNTMSISCFLSGRWGRSSTMISATWFRVRASKASSWGRHRLKIGMMGRRWKDRWEKTAARYLSWHEYECWSTILTALNLGFSRYISCTVANWENPPRFITIHSTLLLPMQAPAGGHTESGQIDHHHHFSGCFP